MALILMIRNLLFLVAIVAPVLSIPSTPLIPTPDPQTSLQSPSLHSRYCTDKTLFQRFRDLIIERIWNIPPNSKCHSPAVKLNQAAPANFRRKYERDVVLRFKIKTEDEAKAFSEAASILYLDIWDYTSDWVDLRIAKDMLPSFLNLLPESLRSSHTPLIHDLVHAVYDTYPSSSQTETWRTRHNPIHRQPHDLFFSNYQPLSVLYPWLKLLASLFPTHVEYFSIGSSAEGRDIPAVRIGAPLQEQEPDDDVNGRKTILVVGGSHAREWISTSTVAFLAYNFATRYGQGHSSTVTKMLKHYDIIFVPTVNPDGYEYTWSTDRLWRKNRQATSLPICPGIDLDRAYGFKWDGDRQTDNPCAESYAGEYPFQAVEAKVLSEWARNQTRVKNTVFSSYLDLHSYSQKVLYPYGFSCDDRPTNLEDLEEVAIGIAKSFRLTTGHLYDVSSACKGRFVTITDKSGKKIETQIEAIGNGGSSLDYFYEELRVRLPFQIKLRDTGTHGFLLPKENIIPTGRETFEAMIGLGRYLLGANGIESDEVLGDEEFTVSEPSREGDEWQHGRPDFLFRTGHSAIEVADEHDNDEWERVYDEELRMRRRR